MQPCLRYRAWIACSGRVPGDKVPNDIYGAAYNRESAEMYNRWLAQLYRVFKHDAYAFLPYHGTPDPAFDTWLESIYLKPCPS